MHPNDDDNNDENTLNRRDDTQPINNRNANDFPVDDDNVQFKRMTSSRMQFHGERYHKKSGSVLTILLTLQHNTGQAI